MAFEDILRSVPLVHKHIMRTRKLMHENRKLREFVEINGLNVSDLLSDKAHDLRVVAKASDTSSEISETTLNSLAESLRIEQNRFADLQADLYVLQMDYDNLLQRMNDIMKSKHTKQD